MAVEPLENDTTIVKQDIIDAYNDVRSVVNAVPASNVGRLALGHQHVATLLAKSGAQPPFAYNEITTDVTVSTTTTTPESTSAMQTSWQRLQATVPGWRLSNGGAGYVMRPGKVLCWANIRISQFAKASSDGRQLALFILTHRADADATDQLTQADLRYQLLDDSNNVNGTARVVDTSGGGTTAPVYEEVASPLSRIVEHSVMLWKVIDKSAVVGTWTLQRLEVKAAVCRGGSTSPTSPINATISGGSIGFIALSDRA
jgi:hypothetical protein